MIIQTVANKDTERERQIDRQTDRQKNRDRETQITFSFSQF